MLQVLLNPQDFDFVPADRLHGHLDAVPCGLDESDTGVQLVVICPRSLQQVSLRVMLCVLQEATACI